MICKVIILLSLCCAVLCAYVGTLSYQALEEKNKSVEPPATWSCAEFLDSPPTETARVLLTEFALGKHLAHLDYDNDQQWDSLCVPFFPKRKQKIGHAYTAALVCFKDIPSKQALNDLLANEEIDANFWPRRQQLDIAIHSQLAQKYKNMDFANSPVLFYGYSGAVPLLGETTLFASASFGTLAIFAGLVAALAGFFTRKQPSPIGVDNNKEEEAPITNRAGLSTGESILDQVTSLRN